MLAVAAAGAQDDLADVPAQDLRAGGNARMRHFLIGPAEGAQEPPEGYRLLIVMPGGDGSEQFHPFVKRIWQNALGGEFIVAQPVAVKWTPEAEVVWPTKGSPVKGQGFSSEEFVAAVIKDVKARHRIDGRYVFTLAWSSSGPAAYQISLDPAVPVTGSLIAMSVFKPDQLPSLTRAAGHPYYLLHSPDDQVCPFRMAREAETQLRANGAKVRMQTYAGGRGWRMPVYPAIRAGVEWLAGNHASPTTQPSAQPTTRPTTRRAR